MRVFCAFTGMFLFLYSGAFGQKIVTRDVPSVIRNAFQQSFPNARDIEWKKKSDGYKVKFETGKEDKDHAIWYNDDGKVESHKEEISKNELPAAVRTAINKDYRWCIIKDIDKHTQDNLVTYEVELKSLIYKWEVTFDSSGRTLKKKRD